VCHCCGEIADAHRQEPHARQRLSPAFERQNQSPEGVSACSERSNPAQVMPLKIKGDFLMHGVVLQIHVFPSAAR
jgi:hypothetical protein